MDQDLQRALLKCETDVGGALNRFSANETLYLACLNMFMDDPTMNDLDVALEGQSWDDAFTAAHAMKGLAGNMGFIPLFHASAELVMLIRAGRVKEIAASYREMKRCYDEIIRAIGRSRRAVQSKGE